MNTAWLTRDGQPRLQLVIADRWWSRARGLLGRRAPGPGEALLLRPCAAVHGVGMFYSVDVIFLDAAQRICKLARLRPFGFVASARAVSVLELRAGAIKRHGFHLGEELAWSA